MDRKPVLDALCALFFFAMAALFAWSFTYELMYGRDCLAPGQPPCRFEDVYFSSKEKPLMALLAVLCAGLGLRMLWGIRHGE